VARLTRLSIAGLPQLVLQRGAGNQAVFRDEQDCLTYLELLRSAAQGHALALHAYLLLPSEVLFLVTPATASGVARTVQAVARHYVRRHNDRHGRSGSLFEARYRSAVVQPDEHVLACMRWVESRPVVLGLCADPLDYRWSSFRHYAGLSVDPLLREPAPYWSLGNTPFERHAAYAAYAREQAPTSETAAIQRAVSGGWAYGSVDFATTLDPARRALPKPPGRPRKPL
jgi:putative transposase